jgi:hypothetical protein
MAAYVYATMCHIQKQQQTPGLAALNILVAEAQDCFYLKKSALMALLAYTY